MKQGLALGIATTLIATVAAAGTPAVSIPIEPAASPIQSSPDSGLGVSPTIPDARALSQINPTAGPIPPRKATVEPTLPSHAARPASPVEQRRETRALNWLAAADYGRFRDLRRAGRNYQATIDDPAGSYTVTVDPATGQITPDSAAADRETRALNVLAAHGYLDVSAIRPAGMAFIATARHDGKHVELDVDPTRGSVTPRS